MIPYKQISLADIFESCRDIYESDKPQFLSLLEKHIDLDEIIPISFRKHYYASTGRNRKYPLNAMLWALIIQRLFSIPHGFPFAYLSSLFQTLKRILWIYQSS